MPDYMARSAGIEDDPYINRDGSFKPVKADDAKPEAIVRGRIASHKTEAEWLEARRRGVGASESPKLVFASGHKIYLEKTTGEQFFKGSDLADFGHRSEDLNAKWFTDVTGKRLTDPGDYTMFWHESLPMFATVDRFAMKAMPANLVIEPREGVCELKAAFGDLACIVEKAKTDDLRHTKLESYYWQVQHQLACTDLDVGYLSIIYFTGYSCGHRWFKCNRDEKVIRAIEKRVKEFWACVENGTPPDWQSATAADMDAIRKMHQPTEGRAVEFSGEQEFTMFSRLESLDLKRKSINKEFDNLKAKFIARMAEEGADRIIAGGKQISYSGKRWRGVKEYREPENGK